MKPKIFVDGRAFDKYFEGTRTYVENLYKIIDKIGDFDIYIGSESDVPERVFENSTNVKFIKYQSQSKPKRAILEIPSIISKHKIDAAHFQYVVPPIKNSIQIVTVHDILFKDFPEHFTFNYRLIKGLSFYLSAIRADILTTVSEYSKQAIHSHFNIKADNIHIVPNGVSSEFFEPHDKNAAKVTVQKKYGLTNFLLYVSRIEPRKNQLELLRAYLDLKLHERGIDMVFVGKTDIHVPEIDRIMENLPKDIAQKIHFLSNIDNHDLKLFYQSALMFVYPSKAEGFGIPPLEAGALKTPTICSNKTAMADFKFFGESHIEPDVEHIKKAILFQLDNHNENQLEEIKNAIAINYNWESSASKLNELIWKKVKA